MVLDPYFPTILMSGIRVLAQLVEASVGTDERVWGRGGDD